MFLKTRQSVSGCVGETGSRQINLKPDYPVENQSVGNATFILVQDLQLNDISGYILLDN